MEIPAHFPLDESQRKTLQEILSLDPRPAYQESPEKEYGMLFDNAEIKFRVNGNILTITDYKKL